MLALAGYLVEMFNFWLAVGGGGGSVRGGGAIMTAIAEIELRLVFVFQCTQSVQRITRLH